MFLNSYFENIWPRLLVMSIRNIRLCSREKVILSTWTQRFKVSEVFLMNSFYFLQWITYMLCPHRWRSYDLFFLPPWAAAGIGVHFNRVAPSTRNLYSGRFTNWATASNIYCKWNKVDEFLRKPWNWSFTKVHPAMISVTTPHKIRFQTRVVKLGRLFSEQNGHL